MSNHSHYVLDPKALCFRPASNAVSSMRIWNEQYTKMSYHTTMCALVVFCSLQAVNVCLFMFVQGFPLRVSARILRQDMHRGDRRLLRQPLRQWRRLPGLGGRQVQVSSWFFTVLPYLSGKCLKVQQTSMLIYENVRVVQKLTTLYCAKVYMDIFRMNILWAYNNERG